MKGSLKPCVKSNHTPEMRTSLLLVVRLLLARKSSPWNTKYPVPARALGDWRTGGVFQIRNNDLFSNRYLALIINQLQAESS